MGSVGSVGSIGSVDSEGPVPPVGPVGSVNPVRSLGSVSPVGSSSYVIFAFCACFERHTPVLNATRCAKIKMVVWKLKVLV